MFMAYMSEFHFIIFIHFIFIIFSSSFIFFFWILFYQQLLNMYQTCSALNTYTCVFVYSQGNAVT